MLGNYLPKSLLIFGAFTALAHTGGIVNVKLEDNHIYRIPEDIIRASVVMDEMIEALGGYGDYVNKDNVISLASVMYGGGSLHLKKLFEIFAVKMGSKGLEDTSIELPKWETSFQNVLQSATSKDLLQLLIAANYLNIPTITTECAKLWAGKFFTSRNDFNELNTDAKKIIIEKLSRENFVALASASVEDFEESFQMALLAHMGFVAPQGFSARELYYQVFYRHPRITTCGYCRM